VHLTPENLLNILFYAQNVATKQRYRAASTKADQPVAGAKLAKKNFFLFR
jgi:hypothetical protein